MSKTEYNIAWNNQKLYIRWRRIISHYAQLSNSEVLSGYLSQVHSGRDLEIEMVKQMHQKYQVRASAYISYISCQPQSFLIMIRLNDM